MYDGITVLCKGDGLIHRSHPNHIADSHQASLSQDEFKNWTRARGKGASLEQDEKAQSCSGLGAYCCIDYSDREYAVT